MQCTCQEAAGSGKDSREMNGRDSTIKKINSKPHSVKQEDCYKLEASLYYLVKPISKR